MNRLHFGLSILSLLSLVACVQVETISCGNCDALPPPQVTSDPGTNSEQCELDPPITTVQKQQNSAWCWAASTSLVINHLEPLRQRRLEQCNVVQTTLTDSIEKKDTELHNQGILGEINCCRVTDDALFNASQSYLSDKVIIASEEVCHTTDRPEKALNANGYQNRFELRWYNPYNTSLQGQGLDWDELTGQICHNRPFISVKHWMNRDGGGNHSEVVTGYHQNPDAWVDLDTHGMDGFYSEPFQDYLGKPGESIHVRDYINIGK